AILRPNRFIISHETVPESSLLYHVGTSVSSEIPPPESKEKPPGLFPGESCRQAAGPLSFTIHPHRMACVSESPAVGMRRADGRRHVNPRRRNPQTNHRPLQRHRPGLRRPPPPPPSTRREPARPTPRRPIRRWHRRNGKTPRADGQDRTDSRKTVPGSPPFLRSAPGNAWPKPLHPRAAYFPAELPVSIPSPRRKGCEDPLPGASGCRFPRRRPRIPILRFAPS